MAIPNSFASSSLGLQARLVERAEPANQTKVHRILDSAMQLDPGNKIAKNLLEKYATK